MPIVMCGDLHLNNWKQFSTVLPNGINSRLVDQMQVVGRISQYLSPKDTMIFGGDLIESYGESLPKIIYSAAFFTLKTWASKCKELYVLLGNHDVYRNTSIVNIYAEIDNVTVIKDTCRIDVEGCSIDLVPWNGDIPEEPAEIFMGHIMPIGAQLGSLYTKRADEGVDIKKLTNYQSIISFHCHEPQEIPIPYSGGKFVICVGSIMQLNFSSSPAPRYLWRLEKGKLSKTEIPSPKIYTTILNNQAEVDNFFSTKQDGYHKLTVTDNTLQFPPLDHTLTVEYTAKPEAGEQIENMKEMDLLEIINEFIDESKTAIDKKVAKELITKLY